MMERELEVPATLANFSTIIGRGPIETESAGSGSGSHFDLKFGPQVHAHGWSVQVADLPVELGGEADALSA